MSFMAICLSLCGTEYSMREMRSRPSATPSSATSSAERWAARSCKNKLFFFGGYQGTTIRQDPSDSIAFVPTAAMLAGDFTAFASPACNGGPADHLESSVRQQPHRSRAIQQTGRGLLEATTEHVRSMRQSHIQQSDAYKRTSGRRQDRLSAERQAPGVRKIFGRQRFYSAFL